MIFLYLNKYKENKMSVNCIRTELLRALRLKYLQEFHHGKATLSIYLNNPVGIGEHPQHLDEMDKLIEKMTTAEDKLSTLEKHFTKFFTTAAETED